MIRTIDREPLFDAVNLFVVLAAAVVAMYPLYFVVIASISGPTAVNTGRVILLPRELTLQGYREVLRHDPIWRGYANSIYYTVVGTVINVSLTIAAGYALSRKDLPLRRLFTFVFVFTLFFQGGLIPRYLLVRNLGLMNTVWALALPSAVNVFYLIICRTFFATTIPDELLDSARIDGCGTFRFFFQIVLPVSPAIIAIMTIYYAVFHWNTFFDGFLFMTNRERYPLQVVLRDLIIQNQSITLDMDPMAADERQRTADLIKFGAIIFASVPVLMLYPFLQKYFVKGVMIGSVKG